MSTPARARITLAASDETAPAFQSVKQRFGQLAAESASITQRFAGFGAAIAGAFGAVSLGALVKTTAEGIDKLNDLADATGSSVANLSALEDIAARTGTSFDTVGTALVKFNATLTAATPGSDKEAAFKALGLSLRELKAVDPSEALRRTAVALSGFADDGNKARLIQELFGKSVREVAPLLADLARQTELVGKVTAEQAREAERFSHNMAIAEKNAVDLARTLSGPLLTALNQMSDTVRGMAANKGGMLGGLADKLGTDYLRARLQATTEQMGEAFGQYQKDLDLLRRQTGSSLSFADAAARVFAERRVAEYRELEDAAEAYRKRIDAILYAGGKRRPANEGGGGLARKSVGDVLGDPQQLSEFDKYIEKLRQTGLASVEFSAQQQALIDTTSGRLSKLSQPEKNTVMLWAQWLDDIKARVQAKADPLGDFVDSLEQRRRAQINNLIEESTPARYERLSILAQRLSEAFSEGQISAEDFSNGAAALGKQFDALGPKVEQLSTFAEQAARNIQDALGQSVEQVLEGKFDSIGRMWADLLRRMAAQAIAANVGQYLFGTGKGGDTGALGAAFGAIFGGFRASGGPVQAGRAYVVGERGPEVIVPRSAGMVVPNGAVPAGGNAAITIVNNVAAGVSRADVVAAVQASSRATEARILSLLAARRVIA